MFDVRGAQLFLLFEHAEHTVGDHIAADDVDGCEHDGGEAEPYGEAIGAGVHCENCADDCDAGNRVGARHEWRVQLRGDFSDQFEAQEGREHEDEE